MLWYKNVRTVLKKQPEVWLAYLYGQQIDNFKPLLKFKPKVQSVIARLCLFVYYMLRRVRLTSGVRFSSHDADVKTYFFYAGSSNQIASLHSTLSALKKKNQCVIAITKPNLIIDGDVDRLYQGYRFSVLDALRAVFLLVLRAPALCHDLRQINSAASKSFLNKFCDVYLYLPFFFKVLKKVNPSFVVVANDHNVANRCLLAVSHYLDIKTVYLQHASVSELFPALRVNYAFLDGKSAYDTYKLCAGNIYHLDVDSPRPTIFLSGQKKCLRRFDHEKADYIGVAVNKLDPVDKVLGLIRELRLSGFSVYLRYHPGQQVEDVDRYLAAAAGDNKIKVSDPKSNDLSSYFSQLSHLIAGNSSIHLEAALVGVVVIYYEFEEADMPDYYGYVANGLAFHASGVNEVISTIRHAARGYKSLNPEAVRFYSHTYDTEWQGREGELVADILLKINKSVSPKEVFGYVSSTYT
jgi:hypothetical protein